jgi:O-antigen ligase
MSWKTFAYVNLICASVAAALWTLFPQLMAWPLLLGVVPWLLRMIHERGWRWRTPFDWPNLLFLFTAFISVWVAYDREMAWAKLWTIVAGILLFYALAAFSLPGAPGTAKEGAFTAALIMAIFGALVSLFFLATYEWNSFPAASAALDGNVAGGILAMMIPFSAAVTWQTRRDNNGLGFILGLALLGLTLLGVLVSVERGAWMGLLAAFALAGLWWLIGLVSRRQPEQRRWLFLGSILAISLSLLVFVFLFPDVAYRLINLAGAGSRLDAFRNSLILVQDYPFSGAGLGGFSMLYSTYAYLIHVDFLSHAHNLYLNVAIEQGLFALLALLWMWGLFVRALWRDAADGRLRPFLAAAALSLVTILLHGLVEDALYSSHFLMLLFLPLAFALPYPQPSPQATRRPRWLFPAVSLFMLLVVMALWSRPLRSYAYSNLAAVQQSRAELSRYQWPDWPIQDALRREIDLSRPIAAYKQALALNLNNASANRRLGQIELSLGDYEDSLAHLLTAYEMTPWDNATRQLLGEAYIVNGQVDEGAALWAEVNNAEDQLQIRAFWYEHIGDPERLAAIEAALNGR